MPPIPLPPHFAPPVTDGNFGNLGHMLIYKDTFTMVDAEALSQKHGKVRVLTTCYIPEELRIAKSYLRIVQPKDKNDFSHRYEPIGIGNYKALDADSISEHILGISIKEGLSIGADVMIFQEGAALTQVGKGFSLGLFNSFSFSNNPTNSHGLGNVTVGGIGYGRGETAYSSRPWLRVQFFREISSQISQMPNKTSGEHVQKREREINNFRGALKKAKKPTIAKTVTAARSRYSAEGKRILVITNNLLSLKTYRTILERLGLYEVLTAVDTEKAIQLTRKKMPDLILIDLHLQGLSGEPCTRSIKADETLRDIPMVALSSHPMNGDMEKIREAGCVGYITKPINPRTFLSLVDHYIKIPKPLKTGV
jgi:CheY-like chemotaxis protein